MSKRLESLDKVQEAIQGAIRESHAEAVEAFRDLVAWTAEAGESYREEFLRHEREWYGEGVHAYEEGDEKAPFFSETFLYLLLGKEDARSLLGRLNRLGEALGLSDKELP